MATCAACGKPRGSNNWTLEVPNVRYPGWVTVCGSGCRHRLDNTIRVAAKNKDTVILGVTFQLTESFTIGGTRLYGIGRNGELEWIYIVHPDGRLQCARAQEDGAMRNLVEVKILNLFRRKP